MAQRSIALKINLFFSLVTIVPCVIIAGLFYFQTERSFNTVAEQYTASILNSTTQEVDRIIHSASAYLRVMAESSSADALVSPRIRAQDFARQNVAKSSLFDAVFLLSPSGGVVDVSPRGYVDTARYQQWFKETIGKISPSAMPVTQVAPSWPAVVLFLPVKNEAGVVTGIVAGSIPFKKIWSITDVVSIGITGFIFITDHTGALIAYPDKSKILSPIQPPLLRQEIVRLSKGTTLFQNPTTVRRVCVFSAYKGFSSDRSQKWRIGIIQNAGEYYSALENIKRGLWVIALCALLLTLFLARVCAGNLLKPIHALARATEFISSGDYTRAVHIKTHDELEDLGESFNKMMRDIRLSREILIAEKEQLMVTLRSIGDAVITTDIEGKIILMNRIAENLTGWPMEEAIGKPLDAVFSIFDEKTNMPPVNPIKKTIESGRIREMHSCMLLTRAQNHTPIANSVAPIRDQDSRVIGAVVVFRDVTDARKMAEEKLKVEKLSSLSILAGGLAHDFNNILTAVIANISVAKLHAGHNSELQSLLLESETEALKAKDITQQLMVFSKGGTPTKKAISLKEVISESVLFFTHGAPVKCVFDLADTLWPAEADPGQIAQVINNLTVNAIQAMPHGGVIRVRGENVTLEATTALVPIAPGEYVKILFSDSGCGISAETMLKIFDPYFTTKQTGNGLGLANVYSIIKNHNGHITVGSTVGEGTTFTFYLPRAHVVSPSAKKPKEPKTHQNNSARILVMDDEESIRKVIHRALGIFGFIVHTAATGPETISLYTRAMQAGEPFDIVMLDLTIPGGIGGKEVIEELRRIDPHVKAIVSSGYSTSPTIENYKDYGFSGVAIKPYDAQEIVSAIQKILASDQG